MKKIMISVLLAFIVILSGCSTSKPDEMYKELKEEKADNEDNSYGVYLNKVDLDVNDFKSIDLKETTLNLTPITLKANDLTAAAQSDESIVYAKGSNESDFVKDYSLVKVDKSSLRESEIYTYKGEKGVNVSSMTIGRDNNIYWKQNYADGTFDYMAIRLNDNKYDFIDTMHPDYRKIAYDLQYNLMLKDLGVKEAIGEALKNLRPDKEDIKVPTFEKNEHMILYHYNKDKNILPNFTQTNDKFSYYVLSKLDRENDKYITVDMYSKNLYKGDTKPLFVDRIISIDRQDRAVNSFNGYVIYPRKNENNNFSFITHYIDDSDVMNMENYYEYRTNLKNSKTSNLTRDYIVFSDGGVQKTIKNIYLYDKNNKRGYKMDVSGKEVSYVGSKYPNKLVLKSGNNLEIIDIDKKEIAKIVDIKRVEKNDPYQDVYFNKSSNGANHFYSIKTDEPTNDYKN